MNIVKRPRCFRSKPNYIEQTENDCYECIYGEEYLVIGDLLTPKEK